MQCIYTIFVIVCSVLSNQKTWNGWLIGN